MTVAAGRLLGDRCLGPSRATQFLNVGGRDAALRTGHSLFHGVMCFNFCLAISLWFVIVRLAGSFRLAFLSVSQPGDPTFR